MVETETTIGIGIALVASMIAMGGFVVSAIQTKKQAKVASANLILELLKPWRNESFKQLLEAISVPMVTKYDETKLEEFLNQLENIAIFWKDGTLEETHVKEFFGVNLKSVRDDEFIQSYMKKWVDKQPDYYFVNLRELTKKLDEWKI